MISTSLHSLNQAIEEDFQARLPGYHKSRREGLCLLSALMLECRTPNLMELAAALPREIATPDKRYQYIERQLSNPHIDVDKVSSAYARSVLERLCAEGQTLILMIDQSHINEFNEVLMLSIRVGERAIPLLWRVRSTQGNIGFEVQKDLLEAALPFIPKGAQVMLAADRFYGTAALVGWCQEAGWGYRIRLKGNLTLEHEGAEITTGEAVRLCPEGLTEAELYGRGVRTNIGFLHEKGHKEPWIIAMDCRPNEHRVLDYGMRWGIESMFSDFKSRGFGLMKSKIQRPERLEKLILIMTISMHWAISCGMLQKKKLRQAGKKGVRKIIRSALSLFTEGLRFLRRCLSMALPLPQLWTVWLN